MSTQLFKDQVAVVTGAGVGIGYEICQQLTQQGASVLLNDIDADLAVKAADEISGQGGVCQPYPGDVSKVETMQNMVQEAVAQFGKLTIAVANAGLTSWGDFFSYEQENFDRVMGVNLRGSYFLAQAAAQQMRKQGTGGRILLMSSVTGHQAIKYLSAYSMTKAALEMMAKNLVVELSPYQITINAVAPGATITPRNLVDDPNYEQSWGQLLPIGHVGTTQDIANAALFFLSPHSGQITGQTIVVDGGWTAISPTPSLEFVNK